MVFENVTLFELHLENSRFSATKGESGSEEAGSAGDGASEAESGGGRSKAIPVGLLLLLVVGGVAFRRYRSGDDGGEEGGADRAEGITIEQAAEQ